MRNKNGVLPIGIIGLIVIGFTVAAFFLLGIEPAALHIWALAFLLLSELIFFGALIGLRFADAGHSNVFLKSGITTAVSLYLAATLISLLFAGNFIETVNTFILIEIAVIVLFAIIAIAIFVFSKGIARRNKEDAAKVHTTEPKRGGF